MSYVKPQEVLSPKARVGGVVEVIHDPGPEEMAVARIIWDDQEVLAARWNGDDEHPLGHPISRRQPTWFVVGDYLADEVERAARAAAEKSPSGLAARYREMANDAEREQEAMEWSEGLIGDGSEKG